MAELTQYGYDLPTDEIITGRFKYLVNYWRNRNKFVRSMRENYGGLNKIEAPVSTQYTVRVLHSYIMAGLINQKLSRFLSRPVVQVIPDEDLDPAGREKSSRIERGINVANYEIEMRADADVWTRQVTDAVLLDEGVTKIVRAPGAWWPELVAHDKAIEEASERNEEVEDKFPLDSPQRVSYKKEQGIPIARLYVPLEFYYPDYDGASLMGSFEVTEKSYVSVANNPLYQNESAQKLLSQFSSNDRDGGLSKTVHIIEFANNIWHGYYLAGPGANSGTNTKWPRVTPNMSNFGGHLQHLYSYQHGLGRSIYNNMGGRFGGWKTNDNRIEGVGKGLLELSEAIDQLLSQMFTNVGAKYWPNLNFQLDPDQRGYGPADTNPDPPKLKEGQAIVTFVGEKIEPIFRPEEDPMAIWLFEKIEQQIGKLGGSDVLFGFKAPGVDTGYHQALQETSAESVDEKIDQNASKAAVTDAIIMLSHVKKIAEPVYMHAVEINKITGAKIGQYVELDPKDLVPMPRMDAKVRKPKPVDLITTIRTAIEASSEREGKGPLMSDDTIHEKLLGTETYDIEYKKILVESQRREIVNSGVLSRQIGDAVNVKLATTGVPEVTPEVLGKTDPALLAAITKGSSMSEGAGGLDPTMVADMATAGRRPGPTIGDPEEQNRLGEAVASNATTGASI